MASAIAHALVGAAIGLLAGAAVKGAAPQPRFAAVGKPGDEPLSGSGVAAGRGKGFEVRLVWLCAALAVLPDADVLMHLFVPYSHAFGHRGALHSPAFYLLTSLLISRLPYFNAQRTRVFLTLFLSLTSHSLLDMMTNGGLGVAAYWPLTDNRYFFPYRPIPVSPLSVAAFFSDWGVRVLSAELPFALPLFGVAWFVHRLAASRPHRDGTAANRQKDPAQNTTVQQQKTRQREHPAEDDETFTSNGADDVVVFEIEESIDLHAFAPRDMLSVVESYLEAAQERGFAEVRLIHGRGKGVQRARIRKLLATHPGVLRFKDAPHTRGGWGATLVWLKQDEPS